MSSEQVVSTAVKKPKKTSSTDSRNDQQVVGTKTPEVSSSAGGAGSKQQVQILSGFIQGNL